jgi:hypothetical protein
MRVCVCPAFSRRQLRVDGCVQLVCAAEAVLSGVSTAARRRTTNARPTRRALLLPPSLAAAARSAAAPLPPRRRAATASAHGWPATREARATEQL